MLTIGYSLKAKLGLKACGDQVGYRWNDDGTLLVCLVDGVGHGPIAQDIARECVNLCTDSQHYCLADLVSSCHLALLNTRGVVMGLALIDARQQSVQYAGVGNIEAIIMQTKTHRFYNQPGIAGSADFEIPVVQTSSFRERESSLIMCSDGIRFPLDLDRFKPQFYESTQSIAEAIIRESSDECDDSSVLVVGWH